MAAALPGGTLKVWAALGAALAGGTALRPDTNSEMTASNEGIGYLLVSAGSAMQMGLAFAGLVTVGAMAMLMYELFSRIEQRVTGWAHRSSHGT